MDARDGNLYEKGVKKNWRILLKRVSPPSYFSIKIRHKLFKTCDIFLPLMLKNIYCDASLKVSIFFIALHIGKHQAYIRKKG